MAFSKYGFPIAITEFNVLDGNLEQKAQGLERAIKADDTRLKPARNRGSWSLGARKAQLSWAFAKH